MALSEPDVLGDIDVQPARSPGEPPTDVLTTLLQPPERVVARTLFTLDGEVAIETSGTAPELGERVAARGRRGVRELEALDLLESQFPARTRVFERLDANDERAALWRDVDDSDGCASRVEQASAIADDKVPKLARGKR